VVSVEYENIEIYKTICQCKSAADLPDRFSNLGGNKRIERTVAYSFIIS
jgi:hypothetical protein